MTTRVDMTVASAALTKVAQQGLLRVDFEDVRAAALAVWHGDELLDLHEVHGPFETEAVSLVERLSLYNVVQRDRKKALLGNVREARRTVGKPDEQTFEKAFRAFLPELQPLQTRHYAVG